MRNLCCQRGSHKRAKRSVEVTVKKRRGEGALCDGAPLKEKEREGRGLALIHKTLHQTLHRTAFFPKSKPPKRLPRVPLAPTYVWNRLPQQEPPLPLVVERPT